MRSTDFSPASATKTRRRSLKGFLQRKWSQVRRSRSKLDVTGESSEDLGSIPRISISAENFSDKFSPSNNFGGQSPAPKQ
jgi:hypothetical protein